MKDKADRRAATRAYKEQEDVGGIYRIIHQPSGWQSPPLCTPNLKGVYSKLQFSQDTGSPSLEELKATWVSHGGKGYEVQVLECLARKPEQSPAEFRDDLKELLKLWQDRA